MTTANGKIFVVDDEASIRRALRTTLSELGFEVVEAARGEEAILLIRTVQFAAVLLDINMPGMGGIEACRRIRQFAPQLPILMLTVRDSEDDKVNALESGADDYVTKPFALRELSARIRAAGKAGPGSVDLSQCPNPHRRHRARPGALCRSRARRYTSRPKNSTCGTI